MSGSSATPARILVALREAAGYAWWRLAHEGDAGDLMVPMSQTEAARIAMEIVMVLRSGEKADFPARINAATEAINSPQHAQDVLLTVAGMAAALAEDEDMERFGRIIARREAEALS